MPNPNEQLDAIIQANQQIEYTTVVEQIIVDGKPQVVNKPVTVYHRNDVAKLAAVLKDLLASTAPAPQQPQQPS